MLLKIISCFKKYATCDIRKLILTRKGSKYGIIKKYTQLFSVITDSILSKHCRLTIYLWVSLSILDFLNQQENFATSVAYVIKLTRVAKAAFIHKILCFEVFKILFGQLVDRMLENKSRQERDAPPPSPTCQERAPLAHTFGFTGQEWSLTS